MSASPDEEDAPSSSMLEQENTDLLQRIADTQSNTWMLEEKVKYFLHWNSNTITGFAVSVVNGRTQL